MRSAQLFRNGNAFRVFRSFWDSSRSQKFGRTTLNQKDGEDLQHDPYEDNFSFTECDQYTKVSVIGAAGRVGKTLSLLLKTCPLIDHLCLFDTDKSVKGVGVDISHIDTKCSVSYVCGMRNIQQALNAPDVVIITAGCPATPTLNGKSLFEKNAPIIAGLSEACARFCPKACVILITSPINSLLPVVGSVYQIITNKIPSRKLFGLTTLDVVRANTFVAEVIRKDPNNIIVPVIGGTSQETIVPVLSQMKPCCRIKRGETVALTECLKRAEENLIDCQNCGTKGASSLSTAYAGFRFTTSLVMALKGAENIVECAFVKSEVIPGLEYLASPLKLGIRGVEFNFGYPPLSDYEVSLMEQAAPALINDIEMDYELVGLEQAVAVLMRDIEMGKSFVSNIEETIEKGLVWKRLAEETGKAVEERRMEKAVKQHKELKARKQRKKEEEERKEMKLQTLTQQVYPEEIQNWGARASFKRFFGGDEIQENCREISTNSISAELASGTCRDDPSLHGGKHFEDLTASRCCSNLFQNLKKTPLTSRKYHTMRKKKETTHKPEDYRRGFTDPSQKMLIPVSDLKKTGNEDNRRALKSPNGNPQYKNLNAVAKQKYRAFNRQKKFAPSASFLFLSEKKKNMKDLTPLTGSFIIKKIEDQYKTEETELEEQQEEEPEIEEVAETTTELTIAEETKEKPPFEQLQELMKENDELKNKIRKMETSELQNERLEMERTKLEACWMIMSSTMDAFSNFCKKFTKPKNEEPEEEEFKEETQKKKQKQLSYDQRYYNFLEKLMEDKIESELSGKKSTQARNKAERNQL